MAENNTKIIIGEDCMLSSEIRITTTDSHSIIDIATNTRINPAKDVIIGNHMWIGTKVSINKGVKIGNKVIIASNSLVTHDVPDNCIAGGIPAKVIKRGVTWSRERI